MFNRGNDNCETVKIVIKRKNRNKLYTWIHMNDHLSYLTTILGGIELEIISQILTFIVIIAE